jgi:hypothetical protein
VRFLRPILLSVFAAATLAALVPGCMDDASDAPEAAAPESGFYIQATHLRDDDVCPSAGDAPSYHLPEDLERVRKAWGYYHGGIWVIQSPLNQHILWYFGIDPSWNRVIWAATSEDGKNYRHQLDDLPGSCHPAKPCTTFDPNGQIYFPGLGLLDSTHGTVAKGNGCIDAPSNPPDKDSQEPGTQINICYSLRAGEQKIENDVATGACQY